MHGQRFGRYMSATETIIRKLLIKSLSTKCILVACLAWPVCPLSSIGVVCVGSSVILALLFELIISQNISLRPLNARMLAAVIAVLIDRRLLMDLGFFLIYNHPSKYGYLKTGLIICIFILYVLGRLTNCTGYEQWLVWTHRLSVIFTMVCTAVDTMYRIVDESSQHDIEQLEAVILLLQCYTFMAFDWPDIYMAAYAACGFSALAKSYNNTLHKSIFMVMTMIRQT